jgi:RNA polymerase sigma-70 factor, ECF subfamily
VIVGRERHMAGAGAGAGGSEEWTGWLDRHGAALVLFARQWVPGRADAEDVVQDAFVRFWRSRHRVSEPLGYLYACVRRGALDWRRARVRRSRREAAAARPEAESLFADPLEQNERQTAVESALRSLSEEQREVLVMKIWGGLSFPEIAAAAGIPTNTAASRYRYALARLHTLLAEEPIHD